MLSATERDFTEAVASAANLTLDARLATRQAARLPAAAWRRRQLDRAIGALHRAQEHQFNSVQPCPPCPPQHPHQLELL